jgi:arsenite-transporting ATPase
MLLSLHLPFVDRDDVQLTRADDELVVTVGPLRRAIVLPDSLVRRQVGAARFAGDTLVVEFVP